MFLSNASVRRPVAMACLIIALLILGFNAFRKMGLEFLPKVDVPYITIVTVYPGASPTEIETDIAKKLEDSVGSIDGLKHMTLTCRENSCLAFLEFHLDVDVDIAATDVRQELDTVINEFPADAENPQILKFDINAKPIVTMALTGDVGVDELYDYADNELNDRLSSIPGVAEVQTIGGAEREVHVLLDREILAARGLTSLDVVQAIQDGVQTIPSGRITQNGSEYSVKFDAEYERVPEIGALEVKKTGASRCYLRDLGEVVMTTEEQRQVSRIDGRPCIAVRIVKKADANAVRVVQRVRGAVAELEPQLPGAMELVWVTDDGAFIEATVDSAVTNIVQGIVLTGCILFFFLFNLRSTFIVAVTMPVTIIIGLAFMQFQGYTLNVSTLLALGLSVGILVTNSIVVIESIVERLQDSDDAQEAARSGAGGVGVAVLASAGTNVVVLFPVAVMQSMVGRFFEPFALTMVIVTLVSLFVSFTLTPILASVLLRTRRQGAGTGRLSRLSERADRAFEWAGDCYAAFLMAVARRRGFGLFILAVVAAVFVHALSLASEVGFGFMPESDQGELLVRLEYPTWYSLEQTEARMDEVEETLRDLPHLEHVLTTIGKVEGVVGQSTEGVYLGQVTVKLADKTERPYDINWYLAQVRERLEDYPGAIVGASIPSGVGGQSNPIELELRGGDLDVLDRLAQKVKTFAEEIPSISDPDTSVRPGKPELRVHPRRAVLADLGIPVTALGLTLRANLEGIEAGVFKRGDRSYDIRVKLAETEGKDQVGQFLFPGAPGRPLMLESLGEVEETVAPVRIIRSDKQRVAKLYGQLHDDAPLGTAVSALNEAIDNRGGLPPGYTYRYIGLYEMMQESGEAFAEAGILALVLTYLVLAAILESFVRPFVILVTIPLGLIGLLWGLYLTGESITQFVLLGGVMLIGIVVNNAILVMDQEAQYLKEGMPVHDAMARAAGDKLRPILMITVAAILGMLPLALSQGLGSEMRNGIGIASVGGIAISAVLTLVVLPVVYDLFTRGNHKAD